MEDRLKNFKTSFVVKKATFINKMKSGNFKFSPDISISFNKTGDVEWETSIGVRALDRENNPFPFDIEVVVSLLTQLPNTLPEEFVLENYLKVSSVNILFPYVRSILASLSSALMVNPLHLPIVDVVAMTKDIEIPGLRG